MTDTNTLATPPADPTPPAPSPPPAAPAPADPAAPAAPPAIATPDPQDPGTPRAQARIEELVAQNKQEREALGELVEYWRQQALRGAAPPSQPASPAAPAEDAAPQLADFDSTEKWAAAHVAWSERQIDKRAAAVVDQRLQARERETTETTVRQTYSQRMAEFEKNTPDARRAIANPTMTAALEKQPAITEVVMASPIGPELAYHLSKAENRAELVRIAQLPPTQAAAAIGRIEAQLASTAAAPKPPAAPPKPTNAPPPPSPIGGAGAPRVDLSKVSIQEYLDIRLKRK